MRTKEDALKTPIAGDRWRIETHDWPWNELTVINPLPGEEIHGRYADHTSTVMSVCGFRAYVCNAEYLGGPNDN